MIIQRLCELYERLEADTSEGATPLAPFGYSVAKISLVIILNKDGEPFDDGAKAKFEDARIEEEQEDGGAARKGKPRKFPRSLVVPAIPGRTVAIEPGFLCDSTAYVLGLAPGAKPGAKPPDPARVRKCFEAFRDRHLDANDQIKDDGFRAVCRFLAAWKPTDARGDPLLEELAGGYAVFQIRGKKGFVHQAEGVREYWDNHVSTNSPARNERGDDASNGSFVGTSLVSGDVEPLARLHEPAIKGVLGAQTSGAKLASFNCSAFESYGKSQTYNAPVGVRDAFRYCTALNHLLASEQQRVRLGDTTVVFWTESPRAVELFGQVVGGRAGQDDALVHDLTQWGRAARQGVSHELGDPETAFFILGLAPNAARLAVRFWIPSTVGQVFRSLARHARDLTLDGAPDGYTLPSLLQIARETVPAKAGWPDDERIAPRLVGELARCVLTGLPYPASLLGAVIARCRVDGWVSDPKRTESVLRVGHRRASIIAACLRRAPHLLEVPMALDENRGDPAYNLGRLFAALDKIAEDASDRAVNRRDKYFASASSNPSSVFPRLMRLSTFDLKKIGAERAAYRVAHERRVQSICDRIDEFPSLLDLRNQGLFCLGFYQQRQALFARVDATVAPHEEPVG